MILQVILEGIGLGVLLILACAIGIRKGAVGMVHLYSPEVQERCVTLGLTSHTKAWTIPGTEDLKPYITARDKAKKWLFGTVGMAVISAALAAIMMLFMKI